MYEDTRRGTETMRTEGATYLAAVVGHELNNLTTILQGRLELVRHAIASGEKIDRHVDELARTGREIGITIDRLHVLADNRGVFPELVDVNETIRQAENALREIGGDATIEVIPAPIPATVTASRRALELAILHLTQNAARAGATEIRVRTALENGDEIVIEVRDDGPGIPQPVSQCLTSRRITPEFCGIGLLLARTVAERSGGSLEFGTPESGAAIRLRFRHVKPSTRQVATGEPPQERQPKP